MLPLIEVQRESITKAREARQKSEQGKNRGRMDVATDIVICCQKASTKSRILVEANVNSVVATRMISRLIATGMLDSVREEGTLFYISTQKGIEFARNYLQLFSLLFPDLPCSSKNDNANRLHGLIF